MYISNSSKRKGRSTELYQVPQITIDNELLDIGPLMQYSTADDCSGSNIIQQKLLTEVRTIKYIGTPSRTKNNI